MIIISPELNDRKTDNQAFRNYTALFNFFKILCVSLVVLVTDREEFETLL